MEYRELESDDAIDRIAHRSLETAYADVLSPEIIERAVGGWYGSEEIESYTQDEEMEFVVAVHEGEPVGFGQAHIVEQLGKGRILWIHVDPDHRGEGIGPQILARLLDRMHARGIGTTTAVVLAEHGLGVSFYESHGFERFAERDVEIAGEPFRELVFREATTTATPPELVVTEDGEEYYVDRDETDRGSVAPFSAVYRDPDREHRYGWFCEACESVETAMDTMGRIRCAACENTRKPTRWDAAYL